MARAARAAGTIMCLSTLATSTPAEVATVGGLRWFQLYVLRDEGITRDLIDAGARLRLQRARAHDRRSRSRQPRARRAHRLRDSARSSRRVARSRRRHAAGRCSSRFRRRSPGVTSSGSPARQAAAARQGCAHRRGRAPGLRARRGRDRRLEPRRPAARRCRSDDRRAARGRRGGRRPRRGARRRRRAARHGRRQGARARRTRRARRPCAALWGLAVDGEAGARDVLRLLQAEILNALQLTGCISPAAVGRDRVAPLP